MQKFTQKWTLITLLQPVPQGTEFFWRDWPLHVTLADVFAVDWERTSLPEKLKTVLANQKTIEVTAGSDHNFGPENSPTKVTLLENTTQLHDLHNRIIGVLNDAGAVFNSPQYVGEGYVAHCTVQKSARLAPGQVVKIDSVTLIDMFPHGDGYQRKVLWTIKFK